MNILLIDDSPDDRALTIRELRRELPDVSVKEIVDSQGLSRALEEGGFDLVITDCQLQWTDGLKVLHTVKARCPDCPVIMFTGTGTEEVAVAAMKDGLDDYVLKSAKHFIRLPAAVKSSLKKARQHKAQREAEELVGNILQSVGEGISLIDHDYRIVMANKAFGCQSKMPVEDITGKHCYEISHWTDRPCYENGQDCPTKYTFETGKPYTVIHTHKDKEGKAVYVEVRSYPMKDASGNVASVIEVTNDITEKRKLEDQLRQSQKMEAIGQLAGGIAHDFNNILTAIIGYSNLLQMKMSEDDPLRADIDQILSSCHRAAHLTQSLLAFSRRQIIHPKPVRLNEIVERVSKLLLRLIGEDVVLKTMLADKDLTIMADSGQIEQVLMNLATNARDAMPEGGILSIGTELVNLDDMFIKMHGHNIKPGMYSLLSVTDTGAGMDEPTRKRIFEPFFTTKKLGRGTGLGLSIIYGIVRQHNGIVNVYSEPGKGTKFKIYLPMIVSVIEEIEEGALPPPRGGTETLLVAEDDKEVRGLMKVVLDRFGYKVIEAVDGEEAITKFKENKDKIDIAILDVVMPKKDGKAAYEEMKKLRPELKAIFSSGYGADIIDNKGILKEGVTFIRKPISPNDLLRKVREVLDE
ncbi:MAG: response regulator [Pseudomonadota bacterium]